MTELRDVPPEIGLYRHWRAQVSQAGEQQEPYSTTRAPDLPSEHLLHLLWLRPDLLRQPLRTLDHRLVTVYRPGRWSRGSGPDFVDAKLRFDDGPIQVGAVEVHVQASDWVSHGHDRDPGYAQVLLHVVWRHDRETPTAVGANGNHIAQLELSPYVNMPLVDLQGLLAEDGIPMGKGATPTPCQRSLQTFAPEVVGRLLDIAGEERWRQKASRFALKVERRGVEQALYELLLESLGFTGNRMPFWHLARLAPIGRLREALANDPPSPLRVQAILYGVAGFLQRWQADLQRSTPEGRVYIETMQRQWEPVAPLFPEHMDERSWRLAGIRPANFPQRRIAAAGHLLAGLAQHRLMDLLFAPLRALPTIAPRAALLRCQRQIARRLRVTGEADFWSRRYAITGPQQNRLIDLLGPGRAATMVIDVVLPAAAALSQLGYERTALEIIRALYLCHPRLPANDITRDMLQQFFGADRRRAAVVNSACRQQALIQVYRDFCLSELESCQECALPRLAARLEQRETGASPGSP